MKRVKVVASCAALFAFAACAATLSLSTRAAAQGARGSAAERGRAVYADRCTRCHGADGRGETRMGREVEAPDLSDAAWQKSRGSARMVASVANGRGQMPAFKERLTRRQIADSIAYVRTLRR